MQKYNEPGQIHFVTFKTYNNCPYFKEERFCELYLQNLEFYRQKFKLKIYGYAIIWDHIHQLIWFDTENFTELTISKVMQDFKSMVARQIIDYLSSHPGSQEPLLLARTNDSSMEQGLHATREESRNHKRGLKYHIWQPGFYDFNIYSDKKFAEKLKYIHDNPVKHGVTKDISEYKYCSWRNYELNDHSIFKIDYLEY
ncbi:MAG: hypothetical protein NTX00_01055 [Candidatus Parcubacteria bacterium]|nr:hypothetical protein [Candidatus Parcubacteria bacterium]